MQGARFIDIFVFLIKFKEETNTNTNDTRNNLQNQKSFEEKTKTKQKNTLHKNKSYETFSLSLFFFGFSSSFFRVCKLFLMLLMLINDYVCIVVDNGIVLWIGMFVFIQITNELMDCVNQKCCETDLVIFELAKHLNYSQQISENSRAKHH